MTQRRKGIMVFSYIDRLLAYGIEKGLLEASDVFYARNRLLYTLALPSYEDSDCAKLIDEAAAGKATGVVLADELKALVEEGRRNGVCGETATDGDLFDTKLMDCLLARPSEIISEFNAKYAQSPKEATDWYYDFSRATNYIRVDRIARDVKWQADSPYGKLDITINLSKPEKDPKTIAAAKTMKQTGYPKCALCRENEGFAGDLSHAARENHRLIPITLGGEDYFLQYSPYVYYNEHCIVLNKNHVPMKIDRATFDKLLEFITKFPHYMLGSNADLPIVGGSILTHDHFQGGHYEFPMTRADVEKEVTFKGYEDVKAGIVKWPMSVIRLDGSDRKRIAELAEKILAAWRGYSDESVGILAESDGEKHNTITPIARRRGNLYELDLVLRNNRTDAENPLGIFHPHAKLHHIKKENIGLIEVMGLAVLPGRLLNEMAKLKEAMLSGADLRSDEVLAKHADWADEIKAKYPDFTKDNADEIIRKEIGLVFSEVLEDAGVYKRNTEGMEAFMKFISSVN